MIHWHIAPEHLSIQAHHIHIWQHLLTLNPSQQATAYTLLTTDEQQRADRFHFPHHRQRFIAARAGLRHILSRYVQQTPNAIRFTYAEHGKPALVDSGIQFNLSHSQHVAMYAITQDAPIGIDVESAEKTHDYLGIAKRFFAPAEYQQLICLPTPQQPNAFLQIWVQKEAFIKAIGQGLSYPLEQFTVRATQPAQLLTLEQGDITQWNLLDIPIDIPGFVCALATPQTIEQHTYWQLPS